MSKTNKLKITLVRSLAKRLESHKACAKGLGIKRMHQSILLDDTPEIRGMINQISYLIKVEEN